jgi:hypothetical protein
MARSLNDLRRTPPNSKPRSIILIVCEDSKSAPAYFEVLRDKANVSTIEVEIIGDKSGSDPKSVVAEAIARRKGRNHAAKKSVSMSAYDEVWCVFDRETPGTRPTFDGAVACARECGLKLAVSNPCFEYWVLLHFEETCRPFENCAELLKYLKQKHFPDYKKGNVNWSKLDANVSAAIARAKKTIIIKGAGFPNPCTFVHDLVSKIQSISRQPY